MKGGNPSIIAIATMGLSSNKYILGIMILLINLGARYIGNELNEFSHKVLNHKFARRFLIFLVIWMGTRDLICAIILTTCFIVLSNTLLNEQSNYCILPIESPSPISKEEYEIAKQMVNKYETTHHPMPPSASVIPSKNNPISTPATNTASNTASNLPIGNNQVSQDK
jgi:hypothetical protein